MATTYWAFPTQTFTAWDANGDPVASAEVKYFEAGTSTPLTIFTDTALSVPHAVPQVADGNGVFAVAYISGPDEVKIEVRNPAGSLLPGYPVDNITGTPVGGLAADAIVFTPTATLAAVEVQAALEELDDEVARLAGADFTGNVTVATTLEANGELQIDDVVQTPAAVLTSTSNAVALSMTGANKKTLTLDETTTITVADEVADQDVMLWIKQGSTGGTAAWSGVDQWVGGFAPTLSTTTGERDLIVLSSESDGSTIVALHIGAAK